MLPSFEGDGLRVLDFDIENRPLSYLGFDYTTPDITAIAACWSDDVSTLVVWNLGSDGKFWMRDATKMLLGFKAMYDEAGIVTCHNPIRHDLPIINGALIELGLDPLGRKLVSDTYGALKKMRGPSKSQENLSELFGIDAPKKHMTSPMWRDANRLTPHGIDLTRDRVTSDVLQHIELRQELLGRGLLGPPKEWKP